MQTVVPSVAAFGGPSWWEWLVIILLAVLIVCRLVKRRKNRLPAKGPGLRDHEPSTLGVRVRVCEKCGTLVPTGWSCPACGHGKTVPRVLETPSGRPECRSCGGSVSDDDRFCRHCGAALSAEGPERPPVGDGSLAVQDFVGLTCPYDQVVLKPGDKMTLCPHCGVAHHQECWEANGGCTTIGCQAAPQPAR